MTEQERLEHEILELQRIIQSNIERFEKVAADRSRRSWPRSMSATSYERRQVKRGDGEGGRARRRLRLDALGNR